MKKLIDIPDNTVKKLRILAANADTTVKQYIQTVIITHVEKKDKTNQK